MVEIEYTSRGLVNKLEEQFEEAVSNPGTFGDTECRNFKNTVTKLHMQIAQNEADAVRNNIQAATEEIELLVTVIKAEESLTGGQVNAVDTARELFDAMRDVLDTGELIPDTRFDAVTTARRDADFVNFCEEAELDSEIAEVVFGGLVEELENIRGKEPESLHEKT